MANDLRINGEDYDSNDLTFREEREVRQIVREDLMPEGVEEDDLTVGDILPAVVYVLYKRDHPEFTLDAALDLKPKDIMIEEEVPKGRAGSSAKKTRATSGQQK